MLRLAAWAVVTTVAVSLPYALTPYARSLYTTMGLWAIVAVGLSLLMGFAGQVSLGQGAFYALGAYTSGLLSVRTDCPTVLAVAAAPVLTAAVAVFVGIPLLRLRGHYLAFATLALHLILLALLVSWHGITGGELGLVGIERLGIGGHEIDTKGYASVVWALTLVIVAVSARLVTSRAGRALQAIAVGEAGAQAAGVDVAAYKLRLFVLSAAYAGVAGGMYTFYLNYLSPEAFPVLISVQFIVMTAIGGLGTVYGAVFGTIALVVLQQQLQTLGTNPSLPLQAPKVLSLGVYGAILSVVVLFFPRGIVPAAVSALRYVGRRHPVINAAAASEAPVSRGG